MLASVVRIMPRSGRISRAISIAKWCKSMTRHGALAELRGGQFDLVLVNRKLDSDYSDGIEVIRI